MGCFAKTKVTFKTGGALYTEEATLHMNISIVDNLLSLTDNTVIGTYIRSLAGTSILLSFLHVHKRCWRKRKIQISFMTINPCQKLTPIFKRIQVERLFLCQQQTQTYP
ncbi:hypothetical protein B4168_0236 [Anoxybacillus flavithermus]|nr:hypothetical protein B4168_0236 [Anoxybacillus flavithermus]